jgi:hypothetical protein
MSVTIAESPSGVEQILKLLADSEGESELIVPRAALEALAEKADISVALQEASQAIRNRQIHPKFLSIMTDAWRTVVTPPHMALPMSAIGLEHLCRQALASARALMPATVALPSDAVLEIPMMALLLRLLDICRGK